MGMPANFPRMPAIAKPEFVDALAWYHVQKATYGLSKMKYDARDETVELRWPHPDDPKLIGVPRTLAPSVDGPADQRAVGGFTFESKFTSALRPEQVPFVNGVFQTLENEHGCIGEAPTGFGKTTTGCALIADIGRPTCVIVPKGDLDWKPELLKHTTIPESKISEWRGQKLPNPDAWVVIASLQSVYRSGVYPDEVYRRFACVIFDEVHRLGAPEFSAAIRKFPAMFRLGLSATANRRDGKMDLIHSHLGWKHIVGKTDAQQPDYYVIRSEWQPPFDKKGKRQDFDPSRSNWVEDLLIKDPMRNAAIAGAAYRAHKAGRRTILFVKRKDHSALLKDALLGMSVPAHSIVEYNGDVKADDKKRAKDCAAGIILIATYKYTAEGTNIPLLDTALFAHPIYDPTQPAGRILRKHEGKPTPIVLDVWEPLGSCARLAKKRWEILHKNGASWKGEFK